VGGLWFFVSFRINFSDNTRVRIFIFLSRAKCNFFFQNLTLGYMTKTLNQIFVFSSTKIRIFFSAILGIRIFFLEKTITPPPLQVKWSVPNQMYILYIWVEANQCFCIVYNCITLNIHLSRGESHSLVGASLS
jgi:hypothetical protein